MGNIENNIFHKGLSRVQTHRFITGVWHNVYVAPHPYFWWNSNVFSVFVLS